MNCKQIHLSTHLLIYPFSLYTADKACQ